MDTRTRRILIAAKWGVRYQDIAERFGVSKSRISQICTRHGVRRKRRPNSVATTPQTVR